jgi:hypothetical protein
VERGGGEERMGGLRIKRRGEERRGNERKREERIGGLEVKGAELMLC